MTGSIPRRVFPPLLLALCCILGAAAALAAKPQVMKCEQCDAWNEPVEPFRIYANTWYVGTRGLSSILITSDFGHVLIDGGLPQSAPVIAANIVKAGFRVEDVKAILNSHAHPDHAGGIAELQKLSGAPVYARRPSADVLSSGKLARDDPQAARPGSKMTPVERIWIVNSDQLLGIGSLRLRAIATPGHTPGGTTWTWDSCDGDKCLAMVYADSLNPVSAGKFRFGGEGGAGEALAASIATVEKLKCDVLISPHPEGSDLFARIAAVPADEPIAIKDEGGCARYAEAARQKLTERLASEK